MPDYAGFWGEVSKREVHVAETIYCGGGGNQVMLKCIIALDIKCCQVEI